MSKIYFNPPPEEFISKYQEFKSGIKMAEYYGTSQTNIYSYAKKINFKNDIAWSPEDKNQFILKYQELKSASAVSAYYNVCKPTVLKYANKIGFVNQYRNSLTSDEVKYVLENYYLKTSLNLSKELNVSKSLIIKTWRENKLAGKQSRRYYINENYFEEINSFDKAYFLGIIAADGCVYAYRNANKLKMLSLGFHIQEKDIIDLFIKYTGAEYVPYTNDKVITLQINSNKLVNDLSQYNIVERKTWIYEPTHLNSSLMWHFLRGYFDGDGSIYLSGKELPCNWFISICGNEQTMRFFYEFLKKNEINSYVRQDKRKGKYKFPFYNLSIRRNEDKIKFINKLYENSIDLRLSRKYLKCEEFLKLYNKRHPN